MYCRCFKIWHKFHFNLYANASPNERMAFYSTVKLAIANFPWYDSEFIIMLGDFNVVENPLLDRSNVSNDRQKGLAELIDLRDHLSIHDIFRYTNPTKNDVFTFASDINGCLSRLDRVYVSLKLTRSALCTTRSVKLTDHKFFVLWLQS